MKTILLNTVKFIGYLIFTALNNTIAFTQNNLNTSSAIITHQNGTIHYSIGQLINEKYTSIQGGISFGIHQNYRLTALKQNQQKKLNNIQIYPNPVNEYLYVQSVANTNLYYKLYDTTGKILQEMKLINDKNRIDLRILPSGIYYLVLTNIEDKTSNSYQIIKN